MISSNETFFLLGTSHRSAPMQWREQLSASLSARAAINEIASDQAFLAESLLLRTCNRVELYGVASGIHVYEEVEKAFASYYDLDRSLFSKNSFFATGHKALRHLFEVSAGLDSQIIGEAEILGQVKKSYREANDRKSTGPILHRAFQKSFQTAKWILTRTELGRGHVTIGAVAASLAERVIGKLDTCQVLVVGSGEVGAKTAKALRGHNVRSVTVSSPTFQRAEALAKEVQGNALPYEDWSKSLKDYDVVIFCTSAQETLLHKETADQAAKLRKGKPLFVVDLSVPRNVEASVAEVPELYLFDMEDLAKMANDNLRSREHEVKRCHDAIEERSQRLWNKLSSQADIALPESIASSYRKTKGSTNPNPPPWTSLKPAGMNDFSMTA